MSTISGSNSNQTVLSDLARNGGQYFVASNSSSSASFSSKTGYLTDSDTALLQKLTGIPFAANGQPDFEAARKSGEKVTGAIPGGFELAGWSDGENGVQFFAGQVSDDRQSGKLTGDVNSQYVKGMLLSVGNSSSDANRKAFIQYAMSYFDKLSSDDVVGSSNYKPRATFETSA